MINDSINRFLGVLCYPFISLEEFRQNLIGKYISAARKQDRKEARKIKDRLKSQVVGYIRQSYNIYSYDEIYLYLEKCCLYDIWNSQKYGDELELYQDTMRKMARSLISHRDGRIVFKYWKNKEDEELFGGFAGSNKVILFHSLNSHIPLDVIAIVYMLENQHIAERQDICCLDYFYGNIEVADQQLSRVLEQGVSENHLHKGVSRTFASVWDSLMEPFTVEKSRYFREMEWVKGTKEQNLQMLFYLLSCGVVRACLAIKMGGREILRENGDEDFGEPENQDSASGGFRDLKEIRELTECFQDGNALDEYYREHFEEKPGKDKPEKVKAEKEKAEKEKANAIAAHFVKLWNILGKYLPKGAFQGKMCTLILEENPEINTLDENVFLYYALREFYGEAGEDRAGREGKKRKKCILQYLRVRNYLFHVSVQQKTVKGLDYFQKDHYRLHSGLNHLNINNFWEVAIREQLQNRNLYKIEFRTSMQKKASDFKKDVVNFLKAYQKILMEDYCIPVEREGQCGTGKKEYRPYRRFPQVGLVIHFLKREDETLPEKCFQNGRGNCSYFHFGELSRQYENQVKAFTELRNQYSELSKYLVGIDAASLENSTPVWVFAPIYEKARDSSIEQIGRKSRCGEYTQSLGFTFHAGEDFRHILSGLRRIDEAVEFLKFHAGDRIGHGIALGIPPRKWKAENPVIVIPQIEALENYLWAYDTLSKNYSNFQATILAYMEKQIFELSGRIYGERDGCRRAGQEERGFGGISIEVLIAGYHRQFLTDRDAARKDTAGENAETVERNLCRKVCSGEPVLWNAGLLAAARHCKKYVKEMERPVHYEITEQDLLIIEELQKILKKKLGKRGIVIEVNPSSNTAIADLEAVEENQLYELNYMDNEENVIVCINSDDPAVFNTNVSNELAYIYYGMLEKNISREAALRWIDRVRINGLNSSFIRRQESDEMLLQKLDELLKKL